MKYYTQVLKKYAVFDGRAGRKEFWMFALINLIFLVIANILDGSIFRTPLYTSPGGTVYGLIDSLYLLGVFIPTLSVAVRRLHDTNHSGWWMLSFLLPILLLMLMMIPMSHTFLEILGIVDAGVFFVIFYIYLRTLVKDSTPGGNKYGPNPKEA